MYKFKTQYCPKKAMRHDWSECFYAHSLQDYRRSPAKFKYLPEDCKDL